MQRLGRIAPRGAKLFPTRHRPRRRAIQYSRDADDGIEKQRRTGYSAFAEYDGVARGGTVAVIARSEATKQSIFLFAAAMDCFASLAMTALKLSGLFEN
jgi:hypothetical protein